MDDMNGFSVLVIDDDEFMLQMTGIMLEKLGVQRISLCSDPSSILRGNDAIEAGLIICDLNMPKMDGIECMRHLAEAKFPGAIALVSGEEKRILSSAESLAAAQNLNVVGSLEKPFTAQDLQDIVRRAYAHRPIVTLKDNLMVNPEMLRSAIDHEQLIVYYQPKVEIQTKRFVSVESLVRWNHPEYGIIGPNAFIKVAEEFGMINDIAEIVLQIAMTQGGKWYADGLDLKIAINLSLKNLTRLDFPEMSVKKAKAAKLPLANVIFEITETSLMLDYVTCMEILTRLRLKGASLSIDDFGTGFSSLEQLMRIPFLELKIDRSFVSGATSNSAARAILDSSVDLAKRLKMSIVAEGVETKADWDLVASLGCDIAQGYYVAKPLPAEEVMRWAAEWSRINRIIQA